MSEKANPLLFQKDGPIATISLNRPERKNALLFSMRAQLADLCDQINDDPSIRAVILTGIGNDFCSGADVSEMGKAAISGALTRARHMQRVITSLSHVQKPLIGAVRGFALGMGLSLSLACDYIVAGESMRMGCVQRKIGLCPDAGNVWFLTRLIGVAKAKDLVFSARMWGAEEALNMGMVHKVVPNEHILDEALLVAKSFADGPTLALAAAKYMFERASSASLEEFMEMEGSWVPLLAQSVDFKEGTRSFVEKRPPSFAGE
jgi:2-(1,2-epoxy-1,2-dihydrophenyl)acetyl-CoA isomerase